MNKSELLAVCNTLSFPSEATDTFVSAFEILSSNHDALRLMDVNSSLFWRDYFISTGSELVQLDKISSLTGIHKYTLYQLFYIMNYHEAEKRYQQSQINDTIFYDSMMELNYKMLITHNIYDIWGTAFAEWYSGFFRRKIFCIGRLEFTLTQCFADYTNGQYNINKGDPIINVHIPESGPLCPELVIDAFQKAADFFGNCFVSDVIPFDCLSWILYPPVVNLYPEGNLKHFASCFDVIDTVEGQGHDDRWRIFEVSKELDLCNYPENTTLQKSLKRWLLEGNTMGIGAGIFFLHDGTIVPH